LLKLKRVELQGFKSFCDRAELRFTGNGVAAIVGPNGCGKSNLSDAISWVLGEQSAKSLRGTRMEDVIFAGTRDRKPVGMASVTMTLVDPTAHEVVQASNVHVDIPTNGNGSGSNGDGAGTKTKPSEITVTRRLYRSGESEYLVDGHPARLRDIQDIFMGTGLGPECYAIIEQGRIGQLLSSRPQDRRSVIEEAAGITRFKTKRRLAEAKLEGARQNLTRVFDILEEVGRQVNSLKRQASKAKRYEELKAEMDAELRRLLAGRYRVIERAAAKTALDLNMAAEEFQRISNSVVEREQEYKRLQADAFEIENGLTGARRRLADLQLEAERTRGRLATQSQQIASIEERLAQGETEAEQLAGQATTVQAELETQLSRISELEQQLAASRERLAEKSAEREALQDSLRGREKQIEASRQTVLRLLGESSTLRNQVAQVESYLASLERDTARAQKEEQGAVSDIEWLGATQKELSEKAAARKQELESIVAQRRETESSLADRRARVAEARKELDRLRSEFSGIQARRDSLQQILSHRAYTTEAVKRLFTTIEQGQAEGLKPYGVLADFVDVDATYEKAAEEFLHDELEYVVVESWSQAEKGIDFLRSDLEGRATFLVHPKGETGPGVAMREEPAIGPETGIVARLSDVLKLTNGLTHAPADLLPRLNRCFLAEDRTAAQRLASQYPGLYFLLPDGVCYSGAAICGGKKTGSGPLALKRELRELNSQFQTREKELDELAKTRERLEGEVTAFEQELERLRAAQQGQEKEALALDHEMRKVTEDLARANSRLSVARVELGRLTKEKERSEARRAEQGRQLAEMDEGRAQQERTLEAARAEIEQLRAEAVRVGEEHSASRAELAGQEERARAEQDSRRRLEGRRNEIITRRQAIGAEMERLGVERARLLADNIELDRRAESFAGDIAVAEEEVLQLTEREAASRATLAGLDEGLKNLRVESQQAQERRAQIELELVKRQSDLKHLDETSRKDLNVPISELVLPEEVELDELALADIEEKYQQVKGRIEALGPVNPQALEEYEESKQRYDFLNAQRQDLLDSIRDTEKAIHDIDAETRRRFAEAFEAVNAYFREMFKTLFGGGIGEMRLTDETNIGESGIDIVASPPGKKLQNVLLLSGGEKALTAVALLMAIFRYQPSPFCVMDEVDAPLDESNIQRLARLIVEMSQHTQFILITHAKRTMEVAQALYGVTMQEPGVSKLVSVRFQQDAPPPPLVPSAPAEMQGAPN